MARGLDLGTFEPVKREGSSPKRLRIIGALLFGAVCAALTYEGARRGMAGRGDTLVLEQGDTEAMISQLAQEEVTRKVAQQAASGLPVAAVEMAQSLASNSSIVIDCSRKAAYVLLQTSFSSIAANTSKENATMYEKDAKLATAATEAKAKWLASEARYRDAQAAYASAKEAAEYARGKYSDFQSSVTSGQKEWDKLKPKWDKESSQIASQVPVIEQLIAILEKGSAEKAEPQQLAAVLTKVSQLGVPEGNKRMAEHMNVLRGMMLKTDSKGAMKSALKILEGLLDTMKGRKIEIAKTLTKMEKELSDNKIALKVCVALVTPAVFRIVVS
jgi:hypothetical protein